MTLTEVIDELCAECRNYFTSDKDKLSGDFTITNGSLNLGDSAKNGQYFRVIGSTFADGIHQNPSVFEQDESFSGCIWLMKIPMQFIRDAVLIKDWIDKYGDESSASPYTSESFDNYSYSKDSTAKGGWKSQFGTTISRWRKYR